MKKQKPFFSEVAEFWTLLRARGYPMLGVPVEALILVDNDFPGQPAKRRTSGLHFDGLPAKLCICVPQAWPAGIFSMIRWTLQLRTTLCGRSRRFACGTAPLRSSYTPNNASCPAGRRGVFVRSGPITFRSKPHRMRSKGGVFVEHYIILARSVTYAQRMQKSLGRAGIRCYIFRPPRDLTDMGCAYAVRIAISDLPEAKAVLQRGCIRR